MTEPNRCTVTIRLAGKIVEPIQTITIKGGSLQYTTEHDKTTALANAVAASRALGKRYPLSADVTASTAFALLDCAQYRIDRLRRQRDSARGHCDRLRMIADTANIDAI